MHIITSAQTPLGEDIDRRARRYLAQMGLRTVCFLGAVFTWGRRPDVAVGHAARRRGRPAVRRRRAGQRGPRASDAADSPLDLREIGAAPLHPPVGPSGPVPPRRQASEPFTARPSTGQPYTASPFTGGPFTREPFTDETVTTPVPGPTRPGSDGSRRD